MVGIYLELTQQKRGPLIALVHGKCGTLSADDVQLFFLLWLYTASSILSWDLKSSL